MPPIDSQGGSAVNGLQGGSSNTLNGTGAVSSGANQAGGKSQKKTKKSKKKPFPTDMDDNFWASVGQGGGGISICKA